MSPEKQRIAMALLDGYTGCVDENCDWRKCQHLHRDGRCHFPQPYSVPSYPDYLSDGDAARGVAKKLDSPAFRIKFVAAFWASRLPPLISSDFDALTASPAEITEAVLRAADRWEEE
jgi:hypothetical protein